MHEWATQHLRKASADSQFCLVSIQRDVQLLQDNGKLREALLNFVADFSNWDSSRSPEYVQISQRLTRAAHVGFGGDVGTSPLVIDPFAGGGSIPLEASRVGADVFASDLNPIPILLNRVLVEYTPRHGKSLGEAVRGWGQWVKQRAEEELKSYYPSGEDGLQTLAYVFARKIACEGPGCGAEVPLLRSLWLRKKSGDHRALTLTPDPEAKSVTATIFEASSASEVLEGTLRRGAVTCPVCDFTTPVANVRTQLIERRGGARDARLMAVVTEGRDGSGRRYRIPEACDHAALREAGLECERRKGLVTEGLSVIPDEEIPLTEIRRVNVPLYGMATWGDIFSPRQAVALSTLSRLVREAPIEGDSAFVAAVRSSLACAVGRQADFSSSLTTWTPGGEFIGHTFTRQAIPMVWDFAECNLLADTSGNWLGAIEWVARVCDANVVAGGGAAQVQLVSATEHPLPDDSADALVTDPPYYDAVPYAHLSDFFYVWLRRILGNTHRDLFAAEATPKAAEIVVDRPHKLSESKKGIEFYERELALAFGEARRVVKPDGIGVVVFASKTTASWEAILQAMLTAGWIVTASWPIDSERGARLAAQGQARLGSSIHLVCRPRENPDGSLRDDNVGDWREVLAVLPERIHEWMPRLASEGVVGADAIFACLGPALEVFSQYSSVEKASGDEVGLTEYLEEVWAAVSREALGMVFKGADASGFEEDARLTAMWLWTLHTGRGGDQEDSDEGEANRSVRGYALEYDAARKIAQGLGAHLEELSHLVEVRGDTATLLSAAARTRHLFGDESQAAPRARRKGKSQMTLNFGEELEELEEQSRDWTSGASTRPGATVLDQLHQSMVLFGAGRGEALRRFLVEDGIGGNPLFWRLAQSLSALYPSGTDEKRWVDGVLARKKGLGAS